MHFHNRSLLFGDDDDSIFERAVYMEDMDMLDLADEAWQNDLDINDFSSYEELSDAISSAEDDLCRDEDDLFCVNRKTPDYSPAPRPSDENRPKSPSVIQLQRSHPVRRLKPFRMPAEDPEKNPKPRLSIAFCIYAAFFLLLGAGALAGIIVFDQPFFERYDDLWDKIITIAGLILVYILIPAVYLACYYDSRRTYKEAYQAEEAARLQQKKRYTKKRCAKHKKLLYKVYKI
ncbi:MAG: hypothetical protein ACI4LA_04595 [Emergencia sp.]